MPTLHFKGKTIIQTHHLTIPYQQLIPDPSLSCTAHPSIHDNMIIHGDNLLALKALLPLYADQVKCIYIDPPYNTGNESWVYNDNVNSPIHQEWLRKTVERDDLNRHDKWLCMMLPRLKLLKELLRDDGAIFISIDDNEVHHLRMLMDEIFGESNFIATIIWQKAYSPRMDSESFSIAHDYILVYGKTSQAIPKRLGCEQNQKPFSFFDQQTQKLYRRRSLRKEGKDSLRTDVPSMFFSLNAPDGSAVYPIKPNGIEGRWRWSRTRYAKELAAGRVEWVQQDTNWQVYAKQYFDPISSRPPITFWPYDEVGHNHEAQEELAILVGRRLFETPKPMRLIKRILQIATDADSLILDSFAGSGTTAHATLALNAEDGGSRRFILIEQEAYSETLTAERVRRVIHGVPAAKDPLLCAGHGGSFTFFRMDQPLDEAALLSGTHLPTYRELARYVFFTTTGEHLDEGMLDEARFYLGTSRNYEVYMIYQPNITFLKNTPFNLEWAEALGPVQAKTRLIIAPYKLIDDELLHELNIEYCRLPFGIYQFRTST